MAAYNVHQVAEKFGISAHTLRYYDNAGLFPDMQRDKNGARIFTDEQLEWLNIVMCLRSTGLSIADIRHYLALCAQGDSTIEERYQIILAQKKRAEEERAEIDKKLEVLSRKAAYYEKLIGAL
ncbi:MAG: MerR family transcriptional regulator [Clostridia bacterium]|nr:MerR family transcriptional regulator [Clostridia bacterium]